MKKTNKYWVAGAVVAAVLVLATVVGDSSLLQGRWAGSALPETPAGVIDRLDLIGEATTRIHSSVASTTYTLEDIGADVAHIRSKVGDTSWTLESLAASIANSRSVIVSEMREVRDDLTGSSTWTLESLAQKVYSSCR
jgi:hypothetical protein